MIKIFTIIIILFHSSVAVSGEIEDNLKTCLTGKHPILCERYLLTQTQIIQVAKAEKRENFKTCITGKHPILCEKHLLTQTQKTQVVKAEKRENFKTCITGKHSILCEKHLLTQAQKIQVVKAEKRENFKTCITGKHPILCEKHLLTNVQKTQVIKAEKRENLKTCISGKHPILCEKHLLTQAQRTELIRTDKIQPIKTVRKTSNKVTTKPAIKAVPKLVKRSIVPLLSKTNNPTNSNATNVISDGTSIKKIYVCSELSRSEAYSLMSSGHNYLDRDGDGHPCEWGRTSGSSSYSNCHSVSGYYRSNGTYVRGHTRCR